MMQINQMTPRKENGEVVDMKVYFTGKIAGINFNGDITFSKEELGEFIQFPAMENALKQKVVDEIIMGNGESPVE